MQIISLAYIFIDIHPDMICFRRFLVLFYIFAGSTLWSIQELVLVLGVERWWDFSAVKNSTLDLKVVDKSTFKWKCRGRSLCLFSAPSCLQASKQPSQVPWVIAHFLYPASWSQFYCFSKYSCSINNNKICLWQSWHPQHLFYASDGWCSEWFWIAMLFLTVLLS